MTLTRPSVNILFLIAIGNIFCNAVNCEPAGDAKSEADNIGVQNQIYNNGGNGLVIINTCNNCNNSSIGSITINNGKSVTTKTSVSPITTQSRTTTTTKASSIPAMTPPETTPNKVPTTTTIAPITTQSTTTTTTKGFTTPAITIPETAGNEDFLVSFGGNVNVTMSSGVETTIIGPDNASCHIPNLPEPVIMHSTIKTEIGIISCGGYTGLDFTNESNKCHLLSSNNSWVPFPPMNERRIFFAMEEGHGKLFAVGGKRSKNSMEWIDRQKRTSWIRENLPFDIYTHCMAKFNSSHVILTGGMLNGDYSKATKFLSTDDKHQWTEGPEMNNVREGNNCAFVPSTGESEDQVVVVAGDGNGSTVEFLSINAKEWMKKESVPLTMLYWHGVTNAHSSNYSIYVTGGFGYPGPIDDPITTIYGFTHSNTWEVVTRLKNSRYGHTSLSLPRKDIPDCV